MSLASGYIRQSAGVIVTGNTINASDSNNEFNALLAAFDASSGHTHDGTTGGGAPITASSLTGLTTLTTGVVVQTSATTFAARALTGTSGTITISNGTGVSGNPTFTIDAAYVGQASITTVGTVTTGTWSGLFGAVSGANLTNLTAANISGGTAVISISGNAATATKLATARAINGVTFDGTAAITVTADASTLTNTTLNSTVVNSSLTSVGTLTSLTLGGTLAMGANNITSTGSLGATGARLTKGWFTDLQVTNAIAGSVTGNAATVTTNANLTGAVTSSGNATSLGSFTSANLASALTDETGTGVVVFSNAPTLVNPVVGTQTASDNSTKAASTAYVDALLTSGAWTAYTPTASSGGGTIAAYTATGAYKIIGVKTMLVRAAITISNVGTAAGFLTISIPFAAKAVSMAGSALTLSSGVSGSVQMNTVGASVVQALKYDGTSIISVDTILIGLVIELQ